MILSPLYRAMLYCDSVCRTEMGAVRCTGIAYASIAPYCARVCRTAMRLSAMLLHALCRAIPVLRASTWVDDGNTGDEGLCDTGGLHHPSPPGQRRQRLCRS
eukprot:2936525-Rhodomonas_salina.2